MRVIHNVEQGSEEWFELRKQYPLTASEATAIGNNGKGLETLCYKKMAEKYSSAEKERFDNGHTERGKELEPQARELYELETGNKVEEVGFVTDEEISKVGGASPDGKVTDCKTNEEGGLEIKAIDDTSKDAFYFKAIIEFKKTGTFKIDPDHIWQMNQQMLFMGWKWVDYVLYNPNFKQSLLTQRVYADEEKQDAILKGLAKGEAIISEIEENLK